MKYIIKLSFFRNMNIVFYFTYKKFSISKANEKEKNQQFLHLDNWHSSTIFNRLLLYYFLLSLLHLLFYFISFKIIWINLNHMNYYFFLQSLFKKKIKNIYLYLSISNIFLFPSILYTHSMQNTLPYKTIPNNPIERSISWYQPQTNLGVRMQSFNNYRFSNFKELAHTILRKYRTNLSTQNKTVTKGRRDQRGAHNN